MKNKRAVVILTMLFVGIVIVSGSRQSVQAQSYDNAHANRDLDALLKLFTTEGKRPFDKLINNGFEVSYEIRGKAVKASVTGNKLNYLQTEEIKLNKQSVMVREVTKDQALEITTHFYLDKTTQKLTIDRRIRNTTPEIVSLRTMREYVDPKLVQRTQYTRKRGQGVAGQIRSGQLISEPPARDKGTADAGDCHCPEPPPPCMTIVCPPDPNYVSARLVTSVGKRITLHWKGATVLASLRQDITTPPVNEVRFITQINIR